MSLIRLQNISRRYQMGAETIHALREVSLEIERGEYVAIMGPSGSGKSTLMNLIGCLEGGECFADMERRFVPFVRGIVAAQANAGVTILVGHGGLYRCMPPLVLENIDSAFAVNRPMGSTGRVTAGVRDGRLRCLEWCGEVLPD